MKKLLLLFALFFSFSACANAQSQQETTDWINAKLPPVVNAQYYRPLITSGGRLLVLHLIEQNTGRDLGAYDVVSFFSVTSISLMPCDMDGSHHAFCLSFSGQTGGIMGCSDEHHCRVSNTFVLSLETNDAALATSLLKAMQHLVTLAGGKLVNDNLF